MKKLVVSILLLLISAQASLSEQIRVSQQTADGRTIVVVYSPMEAYELKNVKPSVANDPAAYELKNVRPVPVIEIKRASANTQIKLIKIELDSIPGLSDERLEKEAKVK